ncbi:uncharacterized protein LOC124440465 [Xenia sp. Carnegie-2017]|uniref:uncharacterized protein LOC124440465 n=1 Tax=Xenia sp. Carnegie-2017 TaxID=2897299 RepID=UPI001F04BA04|nr:uncharacterized protein LOC124440465 [Xenia sp. Carnegie-2017]
MASGGRNEANLSGNLVPLAKLNDRASSVCHLVLKNGEEIIRQATGFLGQFKIDSVYKPVIITNNHFVSKKQTAASVFATFKFDGRVDCKEVHLDPEIFFQTNKELDYTFIGVKQADIEELQRKFQVTPSKISKKKIRVNENKTDIVYIVQHPKGKPKRISASPICKLDENDVYYLADTDDGSSGSPVFFCKKGEVYVLAVHKIGGTTLDNGQKANRGVLVSSVLENVYRELGIESTASTTNQNSDNSDHEEAGCFAPFTTQGQPVVQPSVVSQQDSRDGGHSIVSSPNGNDPSSSSDFPSLQNLKKTLDQPTCDSAVAVCNRPFEPRELYRIAERICGEWEKVAILTGLFKKWEIDNIAHNTTLHSPSKKSNQMLSNYKARKGTRIELATAIKEAGFLDVAQKVQSGFYIDYVD